MAAPAGAAWRHFRTRTGEKTIMSNDTTTTADADQEGTTDTADESARTGDTVSKADYEKLKAEARKHEGRAKANAEAARELVKLRESSMTELERAVQTARDEATLEVRRQFAGQVVDAEVRAAAAGRPVDVDALLDGVDRTRFLTDGGEADRDAIVAWVDRVAPLPPPSVEGTALFPDLAQGTRGDGSSTALNGDPLLSALKSKLGIS